MFRKNHPYLFFIVIITAFICTTIMIFMLTIYILISENKKLSKGNIGIIKIEQTISQSDYILSCLKDFNEADNIKAIVIRINSPGGSVGPSQEIYRQIRKISARKKIVASMGSMATSGGYYVASAANEIFASKGTLTGSIGVIMSFTNVKQLMEKVGFSKTIIKSGSYKDIGSPIREMSSSEANMLQDLSDDIYDQFISDIAKSRGMSKLKVRNLADGRIFTGRQAMKMGLIDHLGNFDDAIEYAGKISGIKEKLSLVYPRRDPKSLYELVGFHISSIIKEMLHITHSGQIYSQ